MKPLRVAVAATLLLGLARSSWAIPVGEWRADDLMAQAVEMKKSLGLNPNQATLWDQSTRNARAILRARAGRREALEAQLKKAAAHPDADLRALARPMDEDAAATVAEDRQLREIWLTVNDALDDRQRRLVLEQLRSQLERQERPPGAGAEHERPQGRPGGRPEGGARQGHGSLEIGGGVGGGAGNRNGF